MSVPARIGIVTLGVSDLERSVAFYEALGWERCASSMDGVISWFRTADSYLGLFPFAELAADAGVGDDRGSFEGFTLAINVETEDAVARALERAVDAGARIVKPATPMPFGVSSYFADPDGHLWEVAFNPSFPIGEGGRLRIP